MRLISDFRDQYDAHLRDGDLSTTWERKLRVVTNEPAGSEPVEIARTRLAPFRQAFAMLGEMPKLDYFDPEFPSRSGQAFGRVVVGVAGRLFGFYTLCNYWHHGPMEWAPTWAGTAAEAEGAFTLSPEYDDTVKRPSKPMDRWERISSLFAQCKNADNTRAGVAAWHAAWDGWQTGPEPHIAAGSPIYLVRNRYVVANPNLGALGLFRRVDPFTTAQEIEVYLNNELATQRDPVPARTDELIRDAHGFDNHSFRNTTPDRRARKR